MSPSSSRLLLAALLAGVHSFTLVAASAHAADPMITPAPNHAAIAKRQGLPQLSTLSFPFSALPYQVYPFAVGRGPQAGYNICNSTTLGANSMCQTLVFNSPDDFCLWGSPDANGEIGNVEAKVVAYCTKPYHGTRLIPPDAITGLQWVKTSAYIQVTGFIKNSGVGLDENAGNGGELDPHGADLQGNPLGGVVFSNGTADSDGHTLTQVLNWNNFVGNGQFCFKACFNSITKPDYCENRYDLVGCQYNMPSAAKDGEFTECDSDLQDVVGTYVVNGVTSTWSMPDPLTTTPPYQPRVPASTNCKTFQASDLFGAVPSSAVSPSAAATGTGTAKTSAATGTGVKASAGSGSGSASPSSTAKSSSASKTSASVFAAAVFGVVGAFML